MRQFSRLLLVFAAVIWAAGCAQKSGAPLEEKETAANLPNSLTLTAEKELPAFAEGKDIVSRAKSAIGTPYVYGGTTPGGFDCSGLVKWSYSHVGVTLPRTAREQSVVGEKIPNIEDMRAGDIVAFRHPKRGYHTGIYVGDGKFIHSPRKKTRVRINSLSDPYFRETLLGARRVNMAAGENLVAQAQARLDAMIEEKTKLSVSDKTMRAMQAKKKNHTVTAKNSKKGHSLASAQKTKQNSGMASKTQKNLKKAKTESRKAEKITAQKNISRNGKAPSISQKNGKSSKSVAQGKNSRKQLGAARKNDSKAVSMLQKKTHSRSTAKGKHS